MTRFDLLLTLGHNSSAILIKTGDDNKSHIVCGYEEERITRKKSDSAFPHNAIDACMRVGAIKEVTDVYVTHWAIDGNVNNMSPKHWQPSKLPSHKNIISLSPSVTHHDTHAHAAWWYAMAKPGLKPEDTMLFVIDGFGNFGEHISIYKCSGWGPKLIRRFFGYDGSLGLMYQYMTAFMGMKQHEDEYKILGYETHIDNIDLDHSLLQRRIDTEISYYLDSYFDSKKLISDYDPMVRLDALPALQHRMNQRWLKLGRELDLDVVDNVLAPTFENRVVMSYYVQSILEGVVHGLMQIYRPVNVIGSGGVFYNVKLNRKILDWIPGKLCVYPLAGDQGNALGLFAAIGNDLQWPGHLNWGVRPSVKKQMTAPIIKPINMFYFGEGRLNQSGVIELCLRELKVNGMINLVRGAMEFGPRALCNTSTIALPNPAIVNRINKMNNRNTVMPMAPVMNRSQFKHRMLLCNRIHHSEEHMIVALPYKRGAEYDVLGAAHNYKYEYTGRPQVLDNDPIMDHLLSEYPVLINTSFNYHGVPIVYSYQDAVYSHDAENKVSPITTVYLENTK